jgi:hypothetical protein
VAIGVAMIFGGSWGLNNWNIILKYINQVPAGIVEPILNKDASFYMFTLPLLDQLYSFIFVTLIISIASVFIASQNNPNNAIFGADEEDDLLLTRPSRSLVISGFLLFVVLALGKQLARYNLLFSNWGVVSGPGWTDVNVRMPAYSASIIITFALGLIYLTPSVRRNIANKLKKFKVPAKLMVPYVLGIFMGSMLVIWVIVLSIIPSVFQNLKVEPNEISLESPYIENNIKFTKYGFQLDTIEEKEFPVSTVFNRNTINDNKSVFDNIRLWDWRALEEVYNQFQEIRLYYEFNDVDIDRYSINNQIHQLMVSAREMDLNNLPDQSKTFVNKRFKYTHGYGITMTKVNEFTSNGLPNLLVKDIPPKHEFPELEIKEPRIYYGELTNSHVIVNSKTKEFDYPSGEKNVYTEYAGKGGVPITNFWRKFLFGWKFDGNRFLFSGYISNESRLMFNRNIVDRVHQLAPFLKFDKDPYIVLVDGKLYWIVDAYTTSKSFPYSEPFQSKERIEYKEGEYQQALSSDVAPHLEGANYLRNSVKVIVDAYQGDVDFYMYESNDPIIKVWAKIFPGMFKKKEDMPKGLRKHVRYPLDKLSVQGAVYAKYHMTDPAVFYNQEDLWVRATEKYYDRIKPVEPYYVIWERPGYNKPEFSLIQPYTPKNRQVLIGWIAGLSDGENYGKFISYKFPKEKRILGPQQVETKIDQDSYLSGQLTLWDQRGSNVIRGNVLAIPVGKTLIYVEPIYLQSETAAYPELRLVAVMHGDKLSYASNFDEALRGLYSGKTIERGTKAPIKKKGKDNIPTVIKMEEIIQKANDAFNNYLQFMGSKQYNKASGALNELEENLKELQKKATPKGESPNKSMFQNPNK